MRVVVVRSFLTLVPPVCVCVCVFNDYFNHNVSASLGLFVPESLYHKKKEKTLSISGINELKSNVRDAQKGSFSRKCGDKEFIS